MARAVCAICKAVTIPVQVFQMLHYGVDDQVCALCLSIFGVVGAAIAGTGCARPATRKHRAPRLIFRNVDIVFVASLAGLYSQVCLRL